MEIKKQPTTTSRGIQLAKNTLIISFGTFLPKILAVITLPIITAGLSKAEFGVYDLVCILESFFLPCVTLQIHSAAFRFLIETRGNQEQTRRIVSNVIAFVCLTSAIALLCFFFCLYRFNITTRLIVCAFFFFDIVKTAEQQIARGMDKTLLYSMSAIVNSAINVLLVIAFVALLPLRLNGVVMSLMFASLGTTLFLAFKLDISRLIDYRLLSKSTLKELLAFSWPMIPNSLSMWVMNLSNRFILTFFLGLEANAVFSVANKIPSLFSVVQSTFTLAWQENASVASESKDSGEYYGKMFDAVFCLMIGVMAILIASTPILFVILIRGEYDEAYNQMPILFMGVFFNVIVAFLGGIYVAKKETKSVGITTTVAAIANVALILSLVRVIGLYAASISMVVSYLVLAIYRMRDVQKFVRINFNWPKIGLCSLLMVTMCILCFQRNIYLDGINFLLGVTCGIALNRQLFVKVVKAVATKYRKKR